MEDEQSTWSNLSDAPVCGEKRVELKSKALCLLV